MTTVTKALADLPDDAKIYVFTKMDSVKRAVEASNMTGTQDVSFCLTANTMHETNGVSLVAYCSN